ncbi:hypothetical protein VTN77DRAFT_9552 [Rasamsonia byssochlamydoides]|uniref:uncharacterized protein n=1 Tax=Rasamsonia byssochlamydoides TaxID=89139 RepID=UPI003742ED78
MPAPIAKGIIITVSVLVAAGIALYESPQFRRWVNNSRRKLAFALYNLGDEIHPRDVSPQDISMTEEVGEAAEERRRKAREEIMQRRALLESRRRRQSSSSSAMVSFDSLVDKDGRLRSDLEPTAQSTALETGDSKAVLRHTGQPGSDALTEGRLQAQRGLLEAMDRDRLRLTLSSETSSHHPSESLVDLTPTSEFPDAGAGAQVQSVRSPTELAQSEYFSITSNRSEADASEYYYAHPSQPDAQAQSNPFEHPHDDEISTISSVPGSLSHIPREMEDASSDGTLSEWGHPTEGVATPLSWSEVGSVISSDDGHHH